MVVNSVGQKKAFTLKTCLCHCIYPICYISYASRRLNGMVWICCACDNSNFYEIFDHFHNFRFSDTECYYTMHCLYMLLKFFAVEGNVWCLESQVISYGFLTWNPRSYFTASDFIPIECVIQSLLLLYVLVCWSISFSFTICIWSSGISFCWLSKLWYPL